MASLSQRYLFGEAGRLGAINTIFQPSLQFFVLDCCWIHLWCYFMGNMPLFRTYYSNKIDVIFSYVQFLASFLFRSAETDLISVCVSGCWGFQEKGGMKKTGGTLTRCPEAKIQLETEGAQIRAEGSTILLSG